MNILIVTNHFWPEDFRINDLAVGLQSKGHYLSILTAIPDYPSRDLYPEHGFFRKQREDYNGINIFRAPLIPRGSGSGLRLVLNYISYAFSACVLAPFFLRKKFDLVFVFESSPVTVGLPALLMKKLNKAPMVFWVQDLWPETLAATGMIRSSLVLSWVGRLVRYIYKRCDLILIQSRAFMQSVEVLAPPHVPIIYFPNSAEELYKPLQPSENAEELSMLPDGFRVMFAGNIGIAQDFETILSAADLLKHEEEIHWIILGDGSRRPWVAEEIKRRNLVGKVHLLGRQPMQKMPRFFSLADALLVTLKNEPIFELTIPSKIQSYLACGKPIIAALGGEGARVIEESGAGFCCPTENPEALANTVLKTYKLSNDAQRLMGECGIKYFAQQFERNKLLSRLENWMIELTGNR